MAEVNFKALGFKTKEMYDFPKIINLEVYGGDCPCNCIHCPVGITKPEDRKKKFGDKGMNLDLYKKIINEISNHNSSAIRIHSVGEPLLWKDLAEALKIAHGKSIKSWVFTSAVTNDLILLKDMCENTSIIEVSVNSSTKEDYKKTKGIDAFDIVYKNLKYMHDYIKKNNLPTRLIVSRVQSLDEPADKEFVRFWVSSGLVDDAFVRTFHTYNDIINKLTLGEENKHQPCLVHWARFNISSEGYAVICFNELFKEKLNPALILGNLNAQSIAEIWQGSKLVALRKAELTGDYTSFNDIPCKDCYSCQPLNGNRETSEHQVEFLK